MQYEKANARLKTIDKMITKLYTDNAEGRLDDLRLSKMVANLEREAKGLNELVAELEDVDEAKQIEDNYARFFSLAKEYANIDVLDRDILTTFVERIEIGPKILEEGTQKATHRNQPYRQDVKIVYRFIGDLSEGEFTRNLPVAVDF